jgi:hypothetical protein
MRGWDVSGMLMGTRISLISGSSGPKVLYLVRRYSDDGTYESTKVQYSTILSSVWYERRSLADCVNWRRNMDLKRVNGPL